MVRIAVEGVIVVLLKNRLPVPTAPTVSPPRQLS
jgi:hypothetical protein